LSGVRGSVGHFRAAACAFVGDWRHAAACMGWGSMWRPLALEFDGRPMLCCTTASKQTSRHLMQVGCGRKHSPATLIQAMIVGWHQ
jgi:hypothetical protein